MSLANSRPFEGLVTALINELATEPGTDEVLFVLDDYHQVSAGPVHASVAFLLEYLPPGLHLVLAAGVDLRTVQDMLGHRRPGREANRRHQRAAGQHATRPGINAARYAALRRRTRNGPLSWCRRPHDAPSPASHKINADAGSLYQCSSGRVSRQGLEPRTRGLRARPA